MPIHSNECHIRRVRVIVICSSMSYFRQLWALLWKGWIIRTRNPCATFFEVLLPIMAVLGLTFTPYIKFGECGLSLDLKKNSKVDNRGKGPEIFPLRSYQDYDQCNYQGSGDLDCFLYITKENLRGDKSSKAQIHWKIYYYPSNAFTDDLMTELTKLTGIKVNKSSSASDVIRTVRNDSRPRWERQASNEIGFIFNAIPTDDSPQFSYELVNSRMFGKMLDYYYERDAFATNDYRNPYRFLFGRFQIYLNEALLSKLAKDRSIKRDETVRWVDRLFPKFITNELESLTEKVASLFALSMSLFVIFLYAVMCPLIVKRLTDEKIGKVKELMRMMGMSDWVFWSSHFVNYFIVFVFHSMVFTFGLAIYKCPPFQSVNPIVFFLVVLMFGIQMIVFCMALSTLFDRPVMAILGMLVIHVMSISFPLIRLHPFFGALPQHKNLWRLLSSMLPNMALVWNFDLVYRIMRINNYFGFKDIFYVSEYYRSLSVFYILMVQIVSIIFYGFVIWYLDSVWPSEYGIAKPFYFLCMPSYYCPSKGGNMIQDSDVTSNENFEPDPDLKASISLKKVRKVFSSGKGVNDVTLNIFEGQITALLGHNGAGKTTTMNMITGLYSPDSGVIQVNGYNIVSATKMARKSLGLCPQVFTSKPENNYKNCIFSKDNVLFNDLSVRQHLQLFATLKDFPSNGMNEEINRVLNEIRLQDKATNTSKTLSGGMKRRLSLGNAMVGGSQILILDEPSSGLDPEARRGIWEVLQDIRRRKTILLTTHYMEEADV